MFVYIDHRVHQIAQMADDHAVWLHGVFQNVELLDRALPGMPVCVKIDRFVARWALPTARKTLPRSSAVISSHDPYLAEHAHRVVVGLFDQRLHDLLFSLIVEISVG